MEDRDNETERTLSLRDYLSIIKRRRKALLIALSVSVLATLLLAILLPSRYQSTGTILIEQQELPVDLVRSTVTSYADQRVQVISQRVMTTQTLLGIIRRNDLYPWERARESREDLIEEMRDDIAFNMISADVIDPRSGMPRAASIAFTVSYTSESPLLAAKVANELTSLYLNENLTERTRLAQDASQFLDDEANRLSENVAALEGKLAAFKEKNVEQLPEMAQFNMQLMDRTEQELRDARTRQQSLRQQEVYLESQLTQIKPNSMLMADDGERVLSPTDRLKTLRSQLASMQAVYSPEHPDIVRAQSEIAGLEAQTGERSASMADLSRKLDEARGRSAAMREKYAADHPDVQNLAREITQLEVELAKARAQPMVTPAEDASADNPAYIQIRAQVEATRNELSALTTEMVRLKDRLAGYQQKIAVSPGLEREYRELARDYDNAQVKYREIRSKQMEAQVAQNLEIGRKGERFTLIEPPLPPEEPASPNRPLILALGAVLSLLIAAGVAALAESLDTSVRGRGDMLEIFKVAPLAIIPLITVGQDQPHPIRRLSIATGAAALLGVLAIAAVHFFYRPLDVLWFVALRRFGL